MRILIAEDDQVLADGLLRTLRAAGRAVDHVASGTEADAALADNEFDLLILDLGLPQMHGLEVLRKLRARGSALPVLILTAADSVEERVKGLDYGADDYMAKPFSLQELEARVRALTRRGMGGASSTIKHGPLVYDQAGRVATIDGKMVELSARELGLLEVLLQRAGRLVSKDQLVERLCEWGEEVSNNAIEVYIHRLRKKIEKGPIRIATVRGLGYCLEKIAEPELPCAAGQRRACETLPARAALAVRRDPRLDAHAAAAAVADQPGADLAGGAEHRRQAVRPRARVQRAGAARRLVDGRSRRQRAAFDLPQPAREILRADDADHVYYQVLGARGELLSGERDLPVPPDDEQPRRRRGAPARRRDARRAGARGLHCGSRRDAAGAPRRRWCRWPRRGRSARVLATEIIKGVMLPQFVILPLAVLLVWLALVRGIKPLSELEERIRARKPDDLSPLDEQRRAARSGAAGVVDQRPAARG